MNLTPEELIAMAKESHISADDEDDFEDGLSFFCDISALRRFASLVAARTSEECAQKCDDMVLYTGFDCAAAIRAMGERT